MTPSVIISHPHRLWGSQPGTWFSLKGIARGLVDQGVDVTALCVVAPEGSARPRFGDRAEGSGWTERDHEDLAATGARIRLVQAHALHSALDGIAVREAVDEITAERQVDAVIGYFHEATFLPKMLSRRGIVFGMYAMALYDWWFADDPATASALLRSRGWQSRSMPRFMATLAYRSLFRNRMVREVRGLRARLQVRRPMEKADIVFTASNFTRDILNDLWTFEPDRLRTAYLAPDAEFFRVERVPDERCRFIFYGRLTDDKGVFEALQALEMATRGRLDDWSLTVIGSGDRERVRARAAELGIANRVEVRGFARRPELLDALAHSDVAILPSHTESFGLVFAEAQAAGLPVLGYRTGAVPEVVSDGETGWLVELHQIDRLARAVRSVLDDRSSITVRSNASRRRMRERFSWRRVGETFLEGIEWAKTHPRPR